MSMLDDLKKIGVQGIGSYVDGAVEERFGADQRTTAANNAAHDGGAQATSGFDTKKALMIGAGVLAAVVVVAMVVKR